PFGTQGNYDVSFAIDPNDPNLVYIGGTNTGINSPPGGLIRVDVTTLSDPYALVAYDNSDPGAANVTQFNSTGPTSVKPVGGTSNATGLPLGPGQSYGLLATATGGARPGTGSGGNPGGYFNLLRDPDAPFVSNSSLRFTNVRTLNNEGTDAFWAPIQLAPWT